MRKFASAIDLRDGGEATILLTVVVIVRLTIGHRGHGARHRQRMAVLEKMTSGIV